MYKLTIPVLFLLFSSAAAALTTYTYTANATTDEANYNQFSLGTLASPDTITFLMEFPNPATGTGPTQFYLLIIDNTGTPLSSQPSGFGSSSTTNINFSGSNTLTWAAPAGTYSLRVSGTGLSSSLVPYYLTVTNSNGGQIAKVGDFVRNAYLAAFELASTQSTYTVLKSAPTIAFLLRQVVNETFTTVGAQNTTAAGSTYSNLAAGSYVIQALFSSLATLTYQSDSFNCPSYYDPNFPFTSQGLQACTYVAPPAPTTASGTTEDNSTRNRNIALITVFSFVAVAGLIILIVFLAKKSASAGASSAVSAVNESSHVNIEK